MNKLIDIFKNISFGKHISKSIKKEMEFVNDTINSKKHKELSDTINNILTSATCTKTLKNDIEKVLEMYENKETDIIKEETNIVKEENNYSNK